MRLIDLSQPLFDAAPNCPVHPPVSFRRTADHAEGGWRMEEIAMATHTGSHLDAPLHKIAGGKSITDLPLESFAGLARIADLRGVTPDAPITPAMLAPKLKGVTTRDIVLLATGWSDRRAKTDEWLHHSPFLSPDGARRWHRPLLHRRQRAAQRGDAHDPPRRGRMGCRGTAFPGGGFLAAAAAEILGAADELARLLGRVLPAGD